MGWQHGLDLLGAKVDPIATGVQTEEVVSTEQTGVLFATSQKTLPHAAPAGILYREPSMESSGGNEGNLPSLFVNVKTK